LHLGPYTWTVLIVCDSEQVFRGTASQFKSTRDDRRGI